MGAKSQRPNCGPCIMPEKSGESMRVFPLSNWTELDMALYLPTKYRDSAFIFRKEATSCQRWSINFVMTIV